MHVLALDTSTMIQSVAAIRSDGRHEERTFHAGKGHTASLLTSIDRVLDAVDLTPRDIEIAAVGVGPGSFTGLRIGVAAIKSFCFATGAHPVGVSSLAVMAAGVRDGSAATILTVTDARKKEVYGAAWRPHDGTLQAPLITADTFAPAELVAQASGLSAPYVGVGNGFATCGDILQNGLGSDLVWLEKHLWGPSATVLGELARLQYDLKGPDKLEGLEPSYIRLSEAELNWKGDQT